jgi:hypothetical protein
VLCVNYSKWKKNAVTTPTEYSPNAAATAPGKSNAFGNISFAPAPAPASTAPVISGSAFSVHSQTTTNTTTPATAFNLSSSNGDNLLSEVNKAWDEQVGENKVIRGNRMKPMKELIYTRPTKPRFSSFPARLPPSGSSSSKPAVPFSFSSNSAPPTAATTTTNISMNGFLFAPTWAATTPALSTTTTTTPGSGLSFPPSTPATTITSAPAPVEADEQIVLESADKDWNILGEYMIKFFAYRGTNKGAMKIGVGLLKLQTHKTTPGAAKRMVMRNAAGKVMLNIGINSEMNFSKTANQIPGRGETCKINFFGLLDQEHGNEQFAIQCKLEESEALFGKLNELSS